MVSKIDSITIAGVKLGTYRCTRTEGIGIGSSGGVVSYHNVSGGRIARSTYSYRAGIGWVEGINYGLRAWTYINSLRGEQRI